VLKRCTFSRTWYTFLGCLGPPAWITGRLSSVVDVEGDGELGGPGILAGEQDVGILQDMYIESCQTLHTLFARRENIGGESRTDYLYHNGVRRWPYIPFQVLFPFSLPLIA